MYRSYLKNKSGFTLIELLVVVAIIAILSAVIFASLPKSREVSENNSIIRQVREYITAIELTYKANGDSYPYNGFSNLSQYGCLVDTNGDPGCEYNNTVPPMYPDSDGLDVLGTMIKLQALDVRVVDSQGHSFDSITYSTDGDRYRLRYPLKGENTDCGIDSAVQINSGGTNFGDVTICLYESR